MRRGSGQETCWLWVRPSTGKAVQPGHCLWDVVGRIAVDHAQRGLGAGGDVVDLEGKAAVVTGAAAGTGRAIAQRLGRAGVAVVAADIVLEQGKQTVRRIQAKGGSSHVRASRRQIGDDVQHMVEVADRTHKALAFWSTTPAVVATSSRTSPRRVPCSGAPKPRDPAFRW